MSPVAVRSQKRKSPAPSFINLNDCKPILHSTFTNTSTNSSNHGSKAFVFTSSRTLRALQQQEDYGFHQLSPSSSIASSPATPPTPSSTSSNGRHRAQLTLSQLTKHSEGAIDARSLIGPKMREAGFVNLPHTMSSRSDLGTPGTPASPSSPPSSSASSSSFPVSVLFHPTPSNPPIFPPIVFLNPTLLTASSMWEYQRDPRWSFSTATGRSTHASAQQHPPATSSNEATPAASDPSTSGFFPPVAAHPPRRVGMPASSGSSSSDSSGLLSSSGSSSTLVSTDSSPSTGLSSVEETDEDEGKAKALVVEPSEYPFPPTYDHPLPARSRGSRGATASPKTIIYAGPALPSHDHPPTPLSVDRSSSSSPRQEKQPPSPRSRRLSGEKLDKHKPQQALVEPTPTFATARRPANQRQYSLTELYIFMPPAPISRSPIRTPSMTPSMSVSFSRPRAVVDPPPPHRRHHTAPDNVPTLHPERHHRIVSAPLRLSAGTSDGSSSDHDREKASSKRANKTRASAEHVADSSAAVGSLADAHSGDEIAVRGGSRDRERGRDPRGKLLGASQAVRERAAAEKAESAAENAKDGLAALMLAHRERDQEYARHVAADRARDKLVKQTQKQRAHHKLRGRFAQEYEPSESETTMVDHQAFSSKPNKSDVAAVAHLVPVVKSVD
ncbi:hypothetical protein PYCCODRAFT_1455264 [Trametes coccinea BRFM310]|uniref:Uncharacterized protein n=1 Tax=Trametes coccinea (strain BRFM310) TaxID=1353009 RepID=A0A1Y2I6F1_TRAC3|nr:hypothetical protein PYCCODRAFT_1455264 [Trametes coccinea BRFM310]